MFLKPLSSTATTKRPARLSRISVGVTRALASDLVDRADLLLVQRSTSKVRINMRNATCNMQHATCNTAVLLGAIGSLGYPSGRCSIHDGCSCDKSQELCTHVDLSRKNCSVRRAVVLAESFTGSSKSDCTAAFTCHKQSINQSNASLWRGAAS